MKLNLDFLNNNIGKMLLKINCKVMIMLCLLSISIHMQAIDNWLIAATSGMLTASAYVVCREFQDCKVRSTVIQECHDKSIEVPVQLTQTNWRNFAGATAITSGVVSVCGFVNSAYPERMEVLLMSGATFLVPAVIAHGCQHRSLMLEANRIRSEVRENLLAKSGAHESLV